MSPQPLERNPAEDYRPGYPIDHRPARRVAASLKRPVGDFESVAARVVARLTGGRVILQDDGSQDSMVDIRIEYAGRDPGYVEVWTDIDPGYAATWDELTNQGRQLPQELPTPTLQRAWFVTVSGASDFRRLKPELEPLLAGLEAAGETFEWAARRETLEANRNSRVERLVDLGVVGLSSRPVQSAELGIVSLYPEGIVGPPAVTWEPVLNWLANTLTSSRLADVRSKLRKTGASERHAFLGVTFTSPGDVFFALTMHEQTLPSEPPTLPDEITHLWLMHATSPGRCLAWFPDRGWFDPIWHWATD